MPHTLLPHPEFTLSETNSTLAMPGGVTTFALQLRSWEDCPPTPMHHIEQRAYTANTEIRVSEPGLIRHKVVPRIELGYTPVKVSETPRALHQKSGLKRFGVDINFPCVIVCDVWYRASLTSASCKRKNSPGYRKAFPLAGSTTRRS